MKIRTEESTYEKVMALPRPPHRMPMYPNRALAALVRLATAGELKAVHFTCTEKRMEPACGKPCLVLMNHSCFTDLAIAARVLKDMPYCIVCTGDGFVGKELPMRMLGCIPTRKFVSDVTLIQDIRYALKDLQVSVLMYPEASYTFDGCATPLPRRMGILLKRLGVPVVMIKTTGAFARDPLYNCLQKRSVDVSATVECLFTPEELKDAAVEELDAKLDEAFTFDSFAWQYENQIEINEPFRADGLNRILFRCAACGAEGQMVGRGTELRCGCCGKRWQLNPLGRLEAVNGSTEFPHIPDWYKWERQQVRSELQQGTYRLDTEVEIRMLVDYHAAYHIGRGRLTHDSTGFALYDEAGRELYRQSPKACYSVYADYFWYELGDMVCIGNNDVLFYCFPLQGDIAAKTRMAAEELYKLARPERKRKCAAETQE